MPNFSNSIIYKINGNGLCYIGSTTEPIKKRLRRHLQYIKDRRYCSSSKVLSDPNHTIELIEKVQCENNSELTDREYYWYSNIPNCNDVSPKQQPYNQYEKYIKNNEVQRQKYLERTRKYRAAKKDDWANKEHLAEYNRQYREANREKNNETKRKWRAAKKAEHSSHARLGA
jgi:hypothetical protein